MFVCLNNISTARLSTCQTCLLCLNNIPTARLSTYVEHVCLFK